MRRLVDLRYSFLEKNSILFSSLHKCRQRNMRLCLDSWGTRCESLVQSALWSSEKSNRAIINVLMQPDSCRHSCAVCVWGLFCFIKKGTRWLLPHFGQRGQKRLAAETGDFVRAFLPVPFFLFFFFSPPWYRRCVLHHTCCCLSNHNQFNPLRAGCISAVLSDFCSGQLSNLFLCLLFLSVCFFSLTFIPFEDVSPKRFSKVLFFAPTFTSFTTGE